VGLSFPGFGTMWRISAKIRWTRLKLLQKTKARIDIDNLITCIDIDGLLC